jgi:hypothetical protein
MRTNRLPLLGIVFYLVVQAMAADPPPLAADVRTQIDRDVNDLGN